MKLKFRIYDNKIGQFITHGMKDKLVKKSIDFNTNEEVTLQQDNFTFLQFTGLHDSNLKEIYIGDLVYCGEYEFPYEVMINDFSQIPVIDSELGQEFLYKVNGKLKVVGNVHEGFTE